MKSVAGPRYGDCKAVTHGPTALEPQGVSLFLDMPRGAAMRHMRGPYTQ